MRTIIAGSRTIKQYAVVEQAIRESALNITEVVSGAAYGVDQLGEMYGKRNGLPIRSFPAEWQKYGKSAGYRRNEVMAKNADALIAVWDGESRGTKHMIDIARAAGLTVYVKVVKREQEKGR